MLTMLREYLPWLAPVLVFGLVVFVHELGHFLAAKLTGVYAPRFSIGFGPALWKRRWGETEYRLAALPLGGYVRMASRDDEAVAMLEGGSEEAGRPGATAGDPNAMMPFGPRPIPPDRWFESKPLPARLLIMFAGVTMNVLLAFAVLTGLQLYYGDPKPDPAPVLSRVLPKSPADSAGLAPGDSVVTVAGEPVRTWTDLVAHVSVAPGRPIAMTVVHNGAVRTVTVVPRPTVDTNPESHQVRTLGKIGAGQRLIHHSLAASTALKNAWGQTWTLAGLVVHMVRDLATRHASLRSLSGPLGIAKVSIEAARSGFEALCFLIALLSVNVAVLNLLPIPILDGGQILINVVESIKGRPFSLQVRENLLRAGLVAIGLLFLLVMFNDRCQVFSALC